LAEKKPKRHLKDLMVSSIGKTSAEEVNAVVFYYRITVDPPALSQMLMAVL
jgi:hypothetical protein